MNRVSGQPLFLVNPNSKFDPTSQLVLNPAAWVEPPFGTFGASAAYFNDFRWQRQPSEAMSFGRNFRMGHEGKYNLFVRAEFQNISNRLFLMPPSVGGAFGPPVSPTTSIASPGGVNTSGYGIIPTVGGLTAVPPRSGQIVGRFTF